MQQHFNLIKSGWFRYGSTIVVVCVYLMVLLFIDDNMCSSWMVYISFQSVCLYDVRLSSLVTSFGLRICRVLIVFVCGKYFHCFLCWWPVLGFIRICVYVHSLYFCTMLYAPYACIFICISNYVCMYVYY